MAAETLFEQLGRFPEREALVRGETPTTYGELLRQVDRWRGMLAERGVQRGETVAVHGGFSVGTTSLLLALVAQGNVVVPLTTAVRSERDKCLGIARAAALFALDRDDCWEFARLRPEPDPPLLAKFRKTGEPGLVLLSSGSTGNIKAALHSFPRLLALYDKRAGTAYRTLAFLLLDHIGGINTLFHILTRGGTIISPFERTPEAICAAIERRRVQLLPTTPTFLRMLLISGAWKKHDLGSLELITYGTEPMPPATLHDLRRALPHVRLKQTYGLTEVGILPTRSERDDSLWLAVGGLGFETRVVDHVLWIRTESAMLGYLNAPSPFDAEGWMNTGDLVEQRGEYLRFIGRKSEIINVGGEKVFPAEVENVIQQLENIREVTVRGRPSAVTGNIVVATVELVEPEDPEDLEDRVRRACRRQLAEYKVPAIVEIAAGALCGERFKKTRNVKQQLPSGRP